MHLSWLELTNTHGGQWNGHLGDVLVRPDLHRPLPLRIIRRVHVPRLVARAASTDDDYIRVN